MGRSGDPRKRELKPSERARQDQVLAVARERGTRSGTVVFITAYAEPGDQCSWCDCPDGSAHDDADDPDYVCCLRPARYRMHLMLGSPYEQCVLVCEEHSDDAHQWVRECVGRPPTEILQFDIFDEAT
jgi:hypothetical protein